MGSLRLDKNKRHFISMVEMEVEQFQIISNHGQTFHLCNLNFFEKFTLNGGSGEFLVEVVETRSKNPQKFKFK